MKPGIDYIDIAGNNVSEYMMKEQLKHVATIKNKIEFKPMEFEGLISKSGIIVGNPTLPHASAMAYWSPGSSNQGRGIHSE